MTITTHRVKQYNSTCKTVVCVDNKPICIVSGNGKTLSNIVSYLSGYKTEIADGQVKKALDKCIGKAEKDFPQAEDIKPTVENFSNLLDNKLIRDATSEERESVNNYIKSISTKTGIKFDDVKAEIKEKCDEINYIVSDLPYSKHRAIQELLCEILASIDKAESEDKNGNNTK